MTHEHNPESAEFRTREAQIRELCASCHFEEVATAHVIEAEARGAAEQRRKDAEGSKIVGWRFRVETCVSEKYTPWILADEDPLPRIKASGCYDRYQVEALCTCSTNVAALAARVKELEGEGERLKTPEWYISQEEGDEADSIADLMECHDPWEIVEIDGYRSVKKVWVFTDAEGDTHQFGTKEAAVRRRVAAIREGGEHV